MGNRRGNYGVHEMNGWIKCSDKLPEIGDVVFGYGYWEGEINGKSDEASVGWGDWTGDSVRLDGDCYTAEIVDVTHWMPAFVEPPKD
jgi:hypothetical protein